MLTKGECYEALLEMKMMGGIYIPLGAFDTIESLINEHFTPEPYKVEELEPEMWVWDEKYKKIGYIDFIGKYLHITYCDGTMDDSEYQENRFFPVTRVLDYQKR